MKSSATNQSSSIASMDWQIEQLPGLSPEDANKLRGQGITTTLELLQQAGIRPQREALAVQLAVSVPMVNKWVVMADLARIPSVDCKYCGFLLHIGICSTAQLARTSLYDLQKQVTRFQVQILQRADLCPSIGQISNWIQQAQQIASQKNMKRKEDIEN
jgi:predicted RecB family nuclease